MNTDIRILHFFSSQAKEVTLFCTHKTPLAHLPCELIIKPGCYTLFDAHQVHFEHEGLYRIIDYKNMRSFQVIVYEENHLRFFESLAWIFLHGFKDNHMPMDVWIKQAVFRNILMECGPVAVACHKLLLSLGIASRVIGLNVGSDVYKGHVINEVYFNDSWILIDFNQKIYICDSDSNFLSLQDVIKKGGFCATTHKALLQHSSSYNSGLAYSFDEGYICNYSFIYDFYNFPQNLHNWYSEFDIFLCSEDPTKEMFVLDNIAHDFLRFDCVQSATGKKYYTFLNQQSFFEKFYGVIQ